MRQRALAPLTDLELDYVRRAAKLFDIGFFDHALFRIILICRRDVCIANLTCFFVR